MTDKNLRNEVEKFVTDLRGDSDHWKKVLPHANDAEHRARLEVRIQEQHDVAEDLRQILTQTVARPTRILDPISGRQIVAGSKINIGNIDEKERYLRYEVAAKVADFRRHAGEARLRSIKDTWVQAASELQKLLDDYVKACWPEPTVAPEPAKCECWDRGCAGKHNDTAGCLREAPYLLRRIDMENATVNFCEVCADDALQSGLFATVAGSDEPTKG